MSQTLGTRMLCEFFCWRGNFIFPVSFSEEWSWCTKLFIFSFLLHPHLTFTHSFLSLFLYFTLLHSSWTQIVPSKCIHRVINGFELSCILCTRLVCLCSSSSPDATPASDLRTSMFALCLSSQDLKAREVICEQECLVTSRETCVERRLWWSITRKTSR